MTDLSTLLPEDLEPTHRGTLDGHSDTSLAFIRWEHPEPKGRLVIAHGYGEHSERYRHTAKWLHNLGWSVSAMDHRGFGRSGGKRGDADGIHAFVEDLTLFLRHERRYDAERVGAGPRIVEGVPMPPLPVCPQVVLGHSFGGLIALLTLLWHADTMEGLIASSPAITLKPRGWMLNLVEAIVSRIAPHWCIELSNHKDLVCSDPVLVQRYWDDPHCHRKVSAAFAQALQAGREELIGLGHELDRPILLLEAGEDTVVVPHGNEILWEAMKPGLLERHYLEGFRHEIFHDRRRPEAEALAKAWLDRLLHDWTGTPNPLLS